MWQAQHVNMGAGILAPAHETGNFIELRYCDKLKASYGELGALFAHWELLSQDSSRNNALARNFQRFSISPL